MQITESTLKDMHFFPRTFFYKKNTRQKNAQTLRTFQEHTEADEKRRTLDLDIVVFSQLIFNSTTLPLVSCMCKFVLNLFLFNIVFLSCRPE